MGELRMNKKNKTTTKAAWEKLMSSLTDDLWTEILIHLPIKSLLVFKSVSKSWFSIISSHRFAKSHLLTAPKDDQVVIVHREPDEDVQDDDDGSFSLFYLDSVCFSKNLNFPYSQGEYQFQKVFSTLVASDCGIVLVSVDLSDWPVSKKNFDIYLWNPATRHSKLIPPYSQPGDRYASGALGFGFDHIDSDFKVVKVISHHLSAKVYSSKRNAWQSILPKPSDVPHGNTFDVCLHGFLFAIGRNGGMIAFDLNKELFICDINLPVNFSDGVTLLSDFKDTIAVISCDMDDGKIQLWTLDDEACLGGRGVKALWTKVFSIGVGVSLLAVEGFFNNYKFFLVDSGGDRFIYDVNQEVSTDVYGPYPETREILKYTKSVFSLQGFKRIKWAASSSRFPDW